MARESKSNKKTKTEDTSVSTSEIYGKQKTAAKAPKSSLYSQKNYMFMGIGVVVVLIGFFLMGGGAMPDANTWDTSLIYSFRRITLAPFLVILGLGIVGYALFHNTAEDKDELNNHQ